jgi:hypothetical protein
MNRKSLIKGGALAAGCAVVGAVAGLAGSAASPSSSSPPKPVPGYGAPPRWRDHDGPRMLGRIGPPIHSEAVVPKSSGSGFETVTDDNGKLKSRSGNDLTITEGTATDTYKDATITVPSDVKVFRNGKNATLDDLKDGDFVHVSKSPEQTIVIARDANFRPRFQGGRPGFRHGPAPGAPPPYGP